MWYGQRTFKSHFCKVSSIRPNVVFAFWYKGLGPQGKRSFHKKVAVLELGGWEMFPFAFFVMYCTFEMILERSETEFDGKKKINFSSLSEMCLYNYPQIWSNSMQVVLWIHRKMGLQTINITSKQCRPPSASPHHNMDDLGQWVWVWSQNVAFRYSIMVILKSSFTGNKNA